MSPDDGFLEDMLAEARLALEFVDGLTEADFLVSTVRDDLPALVRTLEQHLEGK